VSISDPAGPFQRADPKGVHKDMLGDLRDLCDAYRQASDSQCWKNAADAV